MRQLEPRGYSSQGRYTTRRCGYSTDSPFGFKLPAARHARYRHGRRKLHPERSAVEGLSGGRRPAVEGLSKRYRIGRAANATTPCIRLRISDLTKHNPTSLRCGDDCPPSRNRPAAGPRPVLSNIEGSTAGSAPCWRACPERGRRVGAGSPGDPELTGGVYSTNHVPRASAWYNQIVRPEARRRGA